MLVKVEEKKSTVSYKKMEGVVILTSSDTFNKFMELHVHFKSTSLAG